MKVEGKQMHIAFLLNSFGFPHGKAATERVRLIGKALVEHDARVTVLCTRNTERHKEAINKISKGIYEGIKYIYTSGSTSRPDSFIGRRIVDIRGLFSGLKWILSQRGKEKVDIIYNFTTIQRVTLCRFLFSSLATILRIPFVLEINELPWLLQEKCRKLDRYINPLYFSAGGIVISDYLMNYTISNSNHKNYNCLDLPILIDTNEYSVSKTKIENWVTFAAAPGYIKELEFILNAMLLVWQVFPQVELHLLGGHSKEQIRACRYNDNHKENIVSHGYVSKDIYRQILSQSYILLVPLFDDTRSRARFPTKIAEYLSTGRPLLTNSAGEINRYFTNDENAFIAESYSVESYSASIIKALESRTLAKIVGLNGRKLAEKYFDYRMHAIRLYNYFNSICNYSYPLRNE